MDGAPQDPDDAVIVFRAVREADLSAARDAVQERGIPTLAVWRPTALPMGMRHRGNFRDGEGELRVPRRHFEEARQALAAHEDESHARIRAHLKGVPRGLARFALLAAVAVFVPLSLVGEVSGWVLGGLAAAIAVLGCMEIAASTRDREQRPVSNPTPPEPPASRQGWFDTSAGRKPKR